MEQITPQITGHHIEVTPAIRSYIEKKFERLHHYGEHITSVNVTLEVNKNKTMQIAKANLHVRGKDFHAEVTEKNLYAAIDLVVDKLARQIKEHRETITDHNG